jgi:cytochrome c-type biogenesis protein CcsB
MDYLLFLSIGFYVTSSILYFFYLNAQKNSYQLAGFYLYVAGFIMHTINLGFWFFKIGYIPAHNLHGTLIIASWALGCVFIISHFKFNLKILGIYVAPLVSMITIFAAHLPNTPLISSQLFKNYWLILHIITIFIGEASFALACGIGLLYLLQEYSIKSKTHGFFFKRLPSLELLDSTGYKCIVIGFSMLSIGLITGLIYAKQTWGNFASWDPKEVWSAITWIIYAVLIHGRVTKGWLGRKSAIMSIFGFLVILFTLFGVNFLLQGHHKPFTTW